MKKILMTLPVMFLLMAGYVLYVSTVYQDSTNLYNEASMLYRWATTNNHLMNYDYAKSLARQAENKKKEADRKRELADRLVFWE